MKYADHVNFTVLEISVVDIGTEFTHIKQWAIKNKMVINLQKTWRWFSRDSTHGT